MITKFLRVGMRSGDGPTASIEVFGTGMVNSASASLTSGASSCAVLRAASLRGISTSSTDHPPATIDPSSILPIARTGAVPVTSGPQNQSAAEYRGGAQIEM